MNSKKQTADFIDEKVIASILEQTKDTDRRQLLEIIEKAEEAARLLNSDDPGVLARIFEAAHKIKEKIYGKRVVIFAPLYSRYCGYSRNNTIGRRSAFRALRLQVRSAGAAVPCPSS